MTTVIAEIGSSHDGSFGNAIKLIEAAADLGADAVKLQLHISHAESVEGAPRPGHFASEDRSSYFERLAFSRQQWEQLRTVTHEVGLMFFCSPFSFEALEILQETGVDGYKIASGEVTNLPLVQEVVRARKPTLLSSGMTNWSELDQAVDLFPPEADLTVLQCSSKYPCPPELVGLNVIRQMFDRYGRPVGLSDHSMGLAACLAAVAMGATVIEKHITFSRRMYGSDAPYASEPSEFRLLVEEIRALDRMKDNPVDKDILEPYEEMRLVFQKSAVAAQDIPSGKRLTRSDIAFKKVGAGIPPPEALGLIGRLVKHDIIHDQAIAYEDLE